MSDAPAWRPSALLAGSLFLIQGGYYAFNGSLPIALWQAGLPATIVGFTVGAAAMAQIPCALVAGAMIDRFGGSRLMVLAAALYAFAALGFVMVPVSAGSVPQLIALRALQGAGLSITFPSALAVIPAITAEKVRSVATAIVASAHNVTIAIVPPIALVLVERVSLGAVGLMAFIIAVAGGVMARVTLREVWSERRTVGPPRVVFRRRWIVLMMIELMSAVGWGGLMAFLPQEAAAVGANVAFFFVADALGILITRIPTGWILDRLGARVLVLAGIGASVVGMWLLTLPLTTALMAITGLIMGVGAGLQVTALIVTVGRASSDRDRGSAFAYFTMAMAAGQAVGALTGGVLISSGSFTSILALGLITTAIAGVLACVDRELPQRAAPRAHS